MSVVASRVIFGLRTEVDKVRRLGQYTLEGKIGEGGMGVVYRASHAMLRRPTAIKILRPETAGEDALRRFEREVLLTASLSHPSTVAIFDYGRTPQGLFYYAMEYLDGLNLEQLVGTYGPQPPARVAHIMRQVCGALAEAHAVGLIHRDIKPANILLSSGGETKVSDFGASFQQRHGHETTQITGVGSPAYMSPEQVRMEHLTHQTDIYSLGVTMYRMLTGRLPFQAATQASLTYAILNTVPERPSTLRPDLPPLLDRIVMTAINKDPAQRYRSWLDFGKDLSQAFTALRLEGESLSDSEKFNELRSLPFFEGFGDVALWEVVRIGSWKKIPAGSVIMREGDHGESFYLLIGGEVSVTLSGTLLNTIKPGGCFGEILYFTDRAERRTTTITANTEVTVIEIRAAALRAATDACQVAFNKAFMRVLIERLMQANLRLAARG
jgi:serine/threonine protein kinase